MTGRRKVYLAAGALGVTLAAYAYARRADLAQLARAYWSPTLGGAPAGQAVGVADHLPYDVAVTWFQPQMTPAADTTQSETVTPGGGFIPLFGFINFGGYGLTPNWGG